MLLNNTNSKETGNVWSRSLKLMGNRFQVSAVADEEPFAEYCIDKAIDEIRRIERLLTTFSEDSDTAAINRKAGISPVVVSEETFALIERSNRISSLTQGAFDISYGSISKDLWNFNTNLKRLPDPDLAKKSVRLINYRNIILDHNNHSVFLKEKGMRIGFGGIGKGYAADRAKLILQQLGIKSGIVNAAGDLTVWGVQPGGQPWTIGIADPNLAGQIYSYMRISDISIATSGNYEKFITIDGKRYSHTINPRTGLPVSGVKSVTIFCRYAEIADAMATPVMVMGVKAGMDLVNQVKDIEAVIVDDHDKIYKSDNIHWS
jgi:thiamine biosynthesis lipoprotein